ncbi:hypothetical protein MTR_8g089010 [Medicago truncatula]|uniref:Uncharacterized protein n=1 Tax=Medicago truncatula TaxID=3880 RepID=G7L9I9_MEDTR|nr:hypothetical protein MTR_8g089010 [Medicago truncatula]
MTSPYQRYLTSKFLNRVTIFQDRATIWRPLFLVKNPIFGLLDRIAPKLPQKIRKKSRIKTPLEGTSYRTPLLKIQNPIV